MAYKCEFCGKGPHAGKSISHSHRKTNRRFLPNLKRMRVYWQGEVQRLYVCTTCLRSGRVQRPPHRTLNVLSGIRTPA